MTLSELRKRLLAQEPLHHNAQQQPNTDICVYPFWCLADNQSVQVRFLPDGNANNTFFWVERAMIKLPFAGIKGIQDSKPLIVQVPCMEMWNEVCPIISEVRALLKDPLLEGIGRIYWKKRSYIFHGFVHENPLNEPVLPDNPVRRLVVNAQLFNFIRAGLINPNLDELPTDYVHGLDFKITKSMVKGYVDYSKSNWVYKSFPLTNEEKRAIKTWGLPDLAIYLPKKPQANELKIIIEMFEASVIGEPYDIEKWGEYYRPANLQSAN